MCFDERTARELLRANRGLKLDRGPALFVSRTPLSQPGFESVARGGMFALTPIVPWQREARDIWVGLIKQSIRRDSGLNLLVKRARQFSALSLRGRADPAGIAEIEELIKRIEGGISVKITWYGHSTFFIEAGGLKIITDPCDIGYPQKPPEADIVTMSHQHFDHNNIEGIMARTILDMPGEWRFEGVKISTIASFHDDARGQKRGGNLIFVFECEGVRIAHLGDLGHFMELPKNLDALLIPVGGNFTVDAQTAAKIIADCQPALAIPMHFKTPVMDFEIADESEFIALTGARRANADSVEISDASRPAGAMVLDYAGQGR